MGGPRHETLKVARNGVYRHAEYELDRLLIVWA